MFKRSTAKTLADILHEIFRGSRRKINGTGYVYQLRADALYDYLYEHEYDAWFLNEAHKLPASSDRALREFVMRLHTGETVIPATPDWSWQQRTQLGQRLLRDLAEDVLVQSQSPAQPIAETAKVLISKLTAQLELDGYILRDGKLYFSETAVLDTTGEEGILEKLAKDLALDNQDVMKHALELSETHYLEGKWSDSIANSRKYLESVLQEVAAKHHAQTSGGSISPSIYDRPVEVRNYLESNGLVEPKEKEAIAKVYGLMSDTGSHPYIAEKDQARLMRYLALTFAQFALLRLQGAFRKRV